MNLSYRTRAASVAAAWLLAPALAAAQSAEPVESRPLPKVAAVAGAPKSVAAEATKLAGKAGGSGTRVPIALDDAIPLPNPEIVAAGLDGDVVLAPPSGNPYFLGFVAGNYFPGDGETIDPELGSALAGLGKDGRPNPEIYGFVMLKKRMTPERLAALSALGLRGLGMHPHYAVRAAFPPDAIPALAQHDAVRWVGLARPWQKLHPHFAATLAAHVGPEPLKVVISVFESDLCEASTSAPVGVATLGGPGQPAQAAPAGGAHGVRWMSNGWQQQALTAIGAAVQEYQPRSLCFRATIAPDRVQDLLALDFVQGVEAQVIDVPHHDESTPMINSDEVREDFGGEVSHKSLAGIIDSGVFDAHNALNHFWWWAWDNSASGTGATQDLCGHGTHVAGTILAEPPSGADLEKRGNAPDLGTWQGGRFRIVKYLDFVASSGKCSGSGTSHSTLYGHMTGTVNDGSVTSAAPQVVNNSWGSSGFWSGTESNAVTLDNQVWDNNQVWVFSAGNDGSATATIGLPAVAKNALTVGSVVDFQDTVGPPGTLSDFSSRGPCKDGRWKPNVVAPGERIISVQSNTTSGYTIKSGTSMAAPHVTGVVAQLADHYDFLRSAPHRMLSLLQASAITKDNQVLTNDTDAHLDQYGCGRISAYKANYGDADWSWTNWGFTGDFSGFDFADFTVPAGTTRLVVCMTYIEPAAGVLASKALVNDFDLWIDSPPVDTGAGNTGEFSAQQSSLDNTEIRIIDNPASGTWRWKVFPDSVSIFSSARVGITVYLISADTTPAANLTVAADDIYVQPNESVNVTATVSPTDYLASAVFLDTSATNAPAYTGAEVTLKDGVVADLTDNFHSGVDLVLGEILDTSSRSATWTVDWASEGVKQFGVSTRSDNMVDTSEAVTVTVDGTDPALVTNLGSSTHTANVWSNDDTITYSWTAATDALSGVDGYGVNLTTGAAAAPGEAKDIEGVTSYAATLATSASGHFFAIKTVDNSGNWTNSFASTGPYKIDTVQPGLVTSLVSTTHTPSVWSNNANISFGWTAATDAHSGIQGYSVLVSSGAAALPDAAQDIALVTGYSTALGSSASGRFFNIRSRDNANNWDADFASVGPYLIDTTNPSGPSALASPTHTVGAWSGTLSATVTWTAATDAHSGLAGYDTVWDHAAGTIPAGVVDTAAGAASNTTVLSASATGWWFHVRARDVAGNLGTTQHFGPLLIDNIAPNGPSGLTSPTHAVGALSTVLNVTVNWTAATDAASGLSGYDTEWSHAAGTIPAGALDTAAGITTKATALTVSTQGWWFHIRARDVAGNWGTTQHLGPFFLGLCNNFASNASYGAGKPGTFGIPLLVPLDTPVLGTTSTVEIQNAKPGAFPTLIVGAMPLAAPFDGGTLLVNPIVFMTLPVAIPASGKLPLTGPLPADPALCGATIYHQVIFTDSGAAGPYHQAMTAGLARILGS